MQTARRSGDCTYVQPFQLALVKESHYYFQLAQHTVCHCLPWYATINLQWL